MSIIADYISSTSPAEQVLLTHIDTLIRATIPDVQEGISYGMPTYIYKNKSLISVIVRKDFFSIYPHSGWVVAELEERLKDFSLSTGTIRFTLTHPLPDQIIKDIILTRQTQINTLPSKN